MNQESDFKTIFNELLGNRAMSVSKLSELSGVPERYIEALRIGNFDQLPPAPYVRGYLNKIASLFSADPGELWKRYKNESEMKVSGISDQLPQNRYSLQKISKGKIAVGAVVACLLLYGVLRFGNIVGAPQLTIENPASATLITSLEHIAVRGIIKPGDQLTINGESEYVGSDGKFEKDVRLYPGINTIEFRVKHFLGREIQDVRKVIYTPVTQDQGQPMDATSTAATSTEKNINNP